VRAIGNASAGKIACMTGVPVVDMSAAPSNVLHMSKMIQVRNVPDELHLALKARALEEGMTLSDYLKRELEEIAGQLTFEQIDARIRARRGSSRLRTEDIVGAVREARGD